MKRSFKDYIAALFEDDEGKPQAKLIFASLCTICVLYVFISTCIFGYNGKAEHLDMFNAVLIFSASLYGISEGRNIADVLTNNKKNKIK
jgi:hypothetical protein